MPSLDHALSRLLDPSLPDRHVREELAQADALGRELSGGRGYIWAAIGIDAEPCPMGCNFCSHAARWHIQEETPPPLSVEAIVERAAAAADDGADFVVLRTTQFYGHDRLLDLGRRVRARIGEDIHLVVNTGESDVEEVRALVDAGFSMAYHVVRLREGIDTGHSVDMRLRSIEAIRAAGMELQYLIEPLGPEHTAEEILVEAHRARTLGASGTGVMARVPVMGTPLAHLGQVSDAWLRRVCAVARLAYSEGGAHCCVHPFTASTLHCGCNTVVVEQAANPRDHVASLGAWRGFDMMAARAVLEGAGFQLRPRHSTRCA